MTPSAASAARTAVSYAPASCISLQRGSNNAIVQLHSSPASPVGRRTHPCGVVSCLGDLPVAAAHSDGRWVCQNEDSSSA